MSNGKRRTGTGSGKGRKAEDFRRDKKLFAGKGFEGTSVRQICDEAGVALALVSYHFGGKDKALYALFEPLNEHFAKLSFNLEEPIKALEAFIRGFVAYRYDNEELIHILQQEMMMQSPRLKMLSNAYYPSWVHLRAILESGKSQGVFQFESIVHAVHFVMGVVIFSRQNPFLEPVFSDLPLRRTMPRRRLSISFALS